MADSPSSGCELDLEYSDYVYLAKLAGKAGRYEGIPSLYFPAY